MVNHTNIKYLNHLSTIFTHSFLRHLLNGTYKERLYRLLDYTGYASLINKGINIAELLNKIYELLLLNYRCEYVYKNTIASQLLSERHSQEGTRLLTEFRACKAKADVVILNGTSNAYENETELDSLHRLESQISSYRKLFDNIYVVTNPLQLSKMYDVLDEGIGILCLTEFNTLETVREAESNKINVEPSAIFDSLRKEEYCSIINQTYGYLPAVSNAYIYSKCKELFCHVQPEIAHEKMVYELKKRSECNFVIDFLSLIPDSLRLLCINSRLSAQHHQILQQRLSEVLSN